MNFIPLKFYVVVCFINFVTPSVLGLILLKNYRSKPSRLFSFFSFFVAGWSWFYFLALLSNDGDIAEYYLRTCMIGVFFMPSLFVHFVTEFINKPRSFKFYVFNYLLSILFTLLVYTPLYAKDPEKFLVFPYWLQPGPIFHVAIIHFAIIVSYSLWFIRKELKTAKGVFRNQLLYIYVGTAIGFIGGSTNYFCWYRIPIPPFLNICVAFYVGFVAIAIIRYKLLDIHFVIRRSITNIVLVTILTSIILVTFAKNLDISKALITTIISLLTVIFLPKLKLRTENIVTHILYKGKYDYLDKIESFIERMALIPKEEDLVNNTMKVLTRDMYIEKASFYILDHVTSDYTIRHKANLDIPIDFKISHEEEIVNWLKENKKIFVLEEEEKILSSQKLINIKKTMETIEGKICVPVKIDSDLMGILVLSNKSSGEMYTHMDLGLLERLGAHLAIALDYKRIEMQLRKEQELASIGVMAMEISHEMRNLLQAPRTFMDLVTERKDDQEFMTTFLTMAKDRIKVTADKLYDIMFMGKERPLNLTSGIDVNQLLDSNLLGNEFSVKKENIEVVKQYSELPPLTADNGQLTHLFNNLILNAIEAMKNKGGKLRIRTQPNNSVTKEMSAKSEKWIRIEVKDDGTGIPQKVLDKLFTPFVTTKSMGGIERSGTGLGLSVVKKVVDSHKGYIYVNTKEGKGTTFVVDLPVSQVGSSSPS